MPEILFKRAATDIVMAKFAMTQDDDYFVQQAAWHVLAVDKFDTQSLDNKAPVPTLEMLKLQ